MCGTDRASSSIPRRQEAQPASVELVFEKDPSKGARSLAGGSIPRHRVLRAPLLRLALTRIILHSSQLDSRHIMDLLALPLPRHPSLSFFLLPPSSPYSKSLKQPPYSCPCVMNGMAMNVRHASSSEDSVERRRAQARKTLQASKTYLFSLAPMVVSCTFAPPSLSRKEIHSHCPQHSGIE